MHESNQNLFDELVDEFDVCRKRMYEINEQVAILHDACTECGSIAWYPSKQRTQRELDGDFIETYQTCFECDNEKVLRRE